MSWHSDPEALLAYAEGRADLAVAWSVETHLVGCDRCREVLTLCLPEADVATLDDARADLALPAPSRLPARPWRAVATGVLGPPWVWAALVVAIIGALTLLGHAPISTAARRTGMSWPLALAPVFPVAMVAAVYELADREPAARTTARGGLELILIRTAAVLGLAVPAVLIGLWSARVDIVTWLLPGLTLCVAALAVGSWTGVERAALGLTGLWVSVVVLGTPVAALATVLDSFLAPSGLGALTWAAALAVAALVVISRHDRFDTAGGRP